ncbi:MAG TPA: ATP-binding cassette domain-containing protein [Candidatus Kapabacteria bacterium]|nr:ATP-binding cassette domain-containing protein [Candidatus Kapabacteria bacterium]
MSFLIIDSISKSFGDYTAVNNISFSVPKGIIFGLLGPNGAGKTTTIRMINNIIIPDKGSILLDGKKVDANTQNIMGYLPEERGLYKKLKVIDQLVYFGRLKGLDSKTAKSKAIQWLEKLGAKGWEDKKIQELSKGMQQKVQFISTMLHDPQFLILDEPFSGFDPLNTDLLKSIILEMKKLGKTIILSTHVMAQVEELCDEILLINKGNIILNGKVNEVKQKYGNNSFLLEFEGEAKNLSEVENIKILKSNNNYIEFQIKDGLPINDILKALIERVDIKKFTKVEPTLHEIFISEVGKQNIKSKEASNE